MQGNLAQVKSNILAELKMRVEDRILEPNNYEVLCKLISKADSISEAQAIAALGTTYKKTGFHFDARLENLSNDIHFLAKDKALSFENDKNAITHKLIIGDNYPALLNLLITYREKIKVIYIDPPYGKDDLGEFAKTNYENAITRDNLLSMLKPRLQIAKMLLKDDGVIFCSIDDRNQAYVKCLFDDIFGEGNFCGNLIWLKGNAQNDADTIQGNQEYILCYAKDIESNPINQITQNEKVKVFKDEKTGKFYYEGAGLSMGGGQGGSLENRPNLGYTFYFNPKTNDIKPIVDYDKESVKTNKTSEIYTDNVKLINQGYIPIRPPKMGVGNGRWKWALEKTLNEIDRILIKSGKNGFSVYYKQWLDSKSVKKDSSGDLYAMIEKQSPPKSFIDFASSGLGTTELKSIMTNKVFNNPKNTKLLKYLLQISTTPNPAQNPYQW